MSTDHRSADARSGFRRVFGVPLRSQTYRNLAYLLLAFPFGLAYFVAVTVGLSVGAGLSLTLVGVPLILVTLLVVGYIGRFEAYLATALLDVRVEPPTVADPTTDTELTSLDGIATAVGRLVGSQATWTSLLFVLLKFVFGVVAFTSLITAVAVVGTLLSMPLLYDTQSVVYTVGPYAVDSLRDALAGSLLGVALAVVALHVLNGLARLGGLLAKAVLGAGLEPAVAGDGDA